MKWKFPWALSNSVLGRTPVQDAEVARLTARADLIVEELDVVVKQLSDMLKTAYRTEND